jgi:hypothetical protein
MKRVKKSVILGYSGSISVHGIYILKFKTKLEADITNKALSS